MFAGLFREEAGQFDDQAIARLFREVTFSDSFSFSYSFSYSLAHSFLQKPFVFPEKNFEYVVFYSFFLGLPIKRPRKRFRGCFGKEAGT